jgi:hypothetical protein
MVDQAVGRQRRDPRGQGVDTEGIARLGHVPNARGSRQWPAPHRARLRGRPGPPVAARAWRAGARPGPRCAVCDVLGHTHLGAIGQRGRPEIGELLQLRARRPPSAAVPNAATTSRRRAAPSGASDSTAPNRCSLTVAPARRSGRGARTRPFRRGDAERPGPPFPLRRQLAEVETGALLGARGGPRHVGAAGRVRAPCSAMCRRMSADARRELTQQSGDTPRPRPAAPGRRPTGPRDAARARPQVRLVDRGRAPVRRQPRWSHALHRPSSPCTMLAITTWVCRCGSRLRFTPWVNDAATRPVVGTISRCSPEPRCA